MADPVHVYCLLLNVIYSTLKNRYFSIQGGPKKCNVKRTIQN